MSGPYIPLAGDLVRMLPVWLPDLPCRILSLDAAGAVPGWLWLDGYLIGNQQQHPGRWQVRPGDLERLPDPAWDHDDQPLPADGSIVAVRPHGVAGLPGAAGRFHAMYVTRSGGGDAILCGWWMHDPAVEICTIRVHLADIEREEAPCTT